MLTNYACLKGRQIKRRKIIAIHLFKSSMSAWHGDIAQLVHSHTRTHSLSVKVKSSGASGSLIRLERQSSSPPTHPTRYREISCGQQHTKRSEFIQGRDTRQSVVANIVITLIIMQRTNVTHIY